MQHMNKIILYLKTLGRTKECTHGRIKKILDVTCYCLYLKTLGRQKYLYKVEFTTNVVCNRQRILHICTLCMLN